MTKDEDKRDYTKDLLQDYDYRVDAGRDKEVKPFQVIKVSITTDQIKGFFKKLFRR